MIRRPLQSFIRHSSFKNQTAVWIHSFLCRGLFSHRRWRRRCRWAARTRVGHQDAIGLTKSTLGRKRYAGWQNQQTITTDALMHETSWARRNAMKWTSYAIETLNSSLPYVTLYYIILHYISSLLYITLHEWTLRYVTVPSQNKNGWRDSRHPDISASSGAGVGGRGGSL